MSSTMQTAAPIVKPEPTNRVPAQMPQLWRRTRRFVMGSIWMIGGSGVILYAGLLIYGLVARLEIDSAVVAGAVEPLKAPAAGTVTAVSPGVGQTFSAGSVLFRVEDPDLEQTIGLQRVTVERAGNDLKLAEATLAAERGRRDDWVVNQRLLVEQSKALVADLASQDETLTKRCAELADLYRRGLSPNWRLYDAQDKFAAVHQALSQARVVLREQQAQLDLGLSGQGAEGIEVIGHLAELTEGVSHARTELALSEETLRVLLARQAQASSVAAEPGRILRILRLAGSQVQAGDTVAVIERNTDRFIYAYLTQSEVGRVSVGDVVDVFLSAQRKDALAKVSAIERAGAYLDDVETRYDWHANRDNPQRLTDRDRTARVTLEFDTDSKGAAERSADVGTPVVLSFSRHREGLLSGFTSLASESSAR